MTRRPKIARLLAAALEDDQDIATRPFEEIAADLAVLEVDPERSITLAHALARRSGSPAARLLGSLAEADEGAEIDALARAPIDEVRSVVPFGTSRALVAAVRRRARATNHVVGFPRRRLRMIGIGGSLVGLAAGLALVVLTQRDHALMTQQAVRALEEQPRPSLAWPNSAAPGAAVARRDSATDMVAEEAEARAGRDRQAATPAAEQTAFLLVDPVLAPGRWRRLSLPEGELDDRLPAARRVAGGRRIVALAADGPAESRREVVIVVRGAGGEGAAADRPSDAIPDALEPVPEAFEVLKLD